MTSGFDGYPSSGVPQNKFLKLEFLRFDGGNLKAWIYKANKFYTYYQKLNG